MKTLAPALLAIVLGIACAKPPAPPAVASNAIAITGEVEKIEAIEEHKFIQYGVATHIDAPPQAVWAVLTDATKFTEWNSTVVSLDGNIAKDEVIKLVAKIDPKRTFKLTVSTFEPSSTMVWEDGNNAFKGCARVASLRLPEGLTALGWGAFQDCSGITTLRLPDGLESIGDNAFDGCTGVASLRLPRALRSSGHRAFYDCIGVRGAVVMREGLESIAQELGIMPPAPQAEGVEVVRYYRSAESVIFVANAAETSRAISLERYELGGGRWVWDALTGVPVNPHALHMEARQVRILRSRPSSTGPVPRPPKPTSRG